MDINKFRQLPGVIKDKEIELIDKSQELNELVLVMDMYRLNILESITGESDNGKPKYSNETKRTAELNKRLEVDGNYKTYSDKVKTIERECKILRVEIDYLRRVFHSEEAIIRGELNAKYK
jgi:hypothetical protein